MKVCFDKLLPRDLVRFRALPPHMRLISRLAAVTAKQWVNGSTLRVKFMGGTSVQQSNVRQAAAEISLYANLKFVFGDDPASEIRIAFVEADGAWSYIGNDALDIPASWPTLNLGWVDFAVCAHELLHAAGMIHEHSQPNADFKWNKPVVNAALSGPPNLWDQNTIDHNIYEKYSREVTNASVFDPDSIMLYFFPDSWVLDGKGSHANKTLSAMDKSWMAKIYPKPAVPVTPVPDNVLPISFVIEKAASISKPGEEDLFHLTIIEPGRYTIQTHGSMDCVMGCYGPNSMTALVAKDDDSGVDHNSWLSLDLTGGLYYVSVRHYSKTKKGDYTISATRHSRQ